MFSRTGIWIWRHLWLCRRGWVCWWWAAYSVKPQEEEWSCSAGIQRFPSATLQGPFQEEPIIFLTAWFLLLCRAGRATRGSWGCSLWPCSACSEDTFIIFTGCLSFLCGSSPYRALCFFLLLKAANPTMNHGSVVSIRAVHCDAVGRWPGFGSQSLHVLCKELRSHSPRPDKKLPPGWLESWGSRFSPLLLL